MKGLLLVYMILATSFARSQTRGIPDTYLKEITAEIGIWKADNSAYQSEKEPFDTYVIEWQWGINKKSIVGKLYGLTGQQASPTFWEFRKYWDGKAQKAVVQQFGGDGTFGTGFIEMMDEKNAKLLQVFTTPAGIQYTTGHKTKIINAHSHVGASYSVDEQGNWTENRSYKWVKKVD